MSQKNNLLLTLSNLFLFLKRKNNYIETFKADLRRTYTTIVIILFCLLLAGDILLSSNGYFTVSGLQFSFYSTLLLTAIFISYPYFSTHKLNTPLVIRASVVHGILLRISYTLFTSVGTRTYDVYRDNWGHLDYIKYIAQNFSLPPVNECQAYHPPIHHIISAVIIGISKLFKLNEFYQLKLIQMAMVLLSSFTLILFYKILKELNCNYIIMLIAISLFAFHPTNIYFSSRINNDNTLLFFYTLSLYFIIRWEKTKSWKDIILLSLAAALAILTKFSGIMLIPLIASVFLITLIRKSSEYKSLIKQYAVFGLIYTPLAVSYQIRNYLLFKQSFSYVPFLGKGFSPTLYNLIFIPFSSFLKSPFNNGGLTGGEFFMEFFIKSSLFGEWQYPGLEKLAILMLILIFIIGLTINFYLISAKKSVFKNHKYIFLLNLIIPVLLEMKLRTNLPIACSQDFRYSAPILISASLFLGEAVKCLINSKFKILKYPIVTCIALFCALSTVFVLSLGYYN